MAIFELEEDIMKVLDDGPWSITGNIVVVQIWDVKKPISEVSFAFVIIGSKSITFLYIKKIS